MKKMASLCVVRPSPRAVLRLNENEMKSVTIELRVEKK